MLSRQARAVVAFDKVTCCGAVIGRAQVVRRFAETGEGDMADDTIARRKFLLGAGLAGTAVAAGLTQDAQAQTPQPAATPPAADPAPEPPTYLTLTAAEVAFFSVVADAMIPADNLSPSGTECGVV